MKILSPMHARRWPGCSRRHDDHVRRLRPVRHPGKAIDAIKESSSGGLRRPNNAGNRRRPGWHPLESGQIRKMICPYVGETSASPNSNLPASSSLGRISTTPHVPWAIAFALAARGHPSPPCSPSQGSWTIVAGQECRELQWRAHIMERGLFGDLAYRPCLEGRQKPKAIFSSIARRRSISFTPFMARRRARVRRRGSKHLVENTR